MGYMFLSQIHVLIHEKNTDIIILSFFLCCQYTLGKFLFSLGIMGVFLNGETSSAYNEDFSIVLKKMSQFLPALSQQLISPGDVCVPKHFHLL